MSYRSSSSDSSAKAIAYLVIFAFLAIFYLWFYSAEVDGQGQVISKWVETNTSCDDDGNCTTTHTYYVQFSDGTVMNTFWGNRDWDRMLEGKHYEYHARGRQISLWGWRLMTPAIFSYEEVPIGR